MRGSLSSPSCRSARKNPGRIRSITISDRGVHQPLRSWRKETVYYVNVAEALTDDKRSLPADASFDGVHPKPDYCKTWLEYLKNHH